MSQQAREGRLEFLKDCPERVLRKTVFVLGVDKMIAWENQAPAERALNIAKYYDGLPPLQWNAFCKKAIQLRAEMENLAPGDIYVPPVPPGPFLMSGLPKVTTKLFGRDDEQATLDRAWEDERPHIVGLIGEGGQGKTVLLHTWLKKFRADRLRGATCVIVHSFYGQGTKTGGSSDDFLSSALHLLDVRDADEDNLAEKAQRLARELRKHRALLVLDGVEPLQVETETDGPAAFEDDGLKKLLRELACGFFGVCLVSSRRSLVDLASHVEDGEYLEMPILPIASEEGAAIVTEAGAQPGAATTQASKRAGFHGLTLRILGKAIGGFLGGDANRLPEILPMEGDIRLEDVLAAIDEKLDPAQRCAMRLIGLFDRPAEIKIVRAISEPPVIEKVTEAVQDTSAEQWLLLTESLREHGLLWPMDSGAVDIVDTHPRIRAYFNSRLRAESVDGFRECHSRIFQPSFPLVTQIGFAGARELFDRDQYPDINPETFAGEVAEALAKIVGNLPSELGLEPSQAFFCGISQIAIGGDTAFTQACKERGILQRLFLPQHVDAYLSAVGSTGPDFSEEQRDTAKNLLKSEHIIQTRAIGNAPDRHDRFQDVNLEIVRVSDLLICLVRGGQEGGAGGTRELIEMAKNRNRPVILLEVNVDAAGKPAITQIKEDDEAPFVSPELPKEMVDAGMAAPSIGAVSTSAHYCKELKDQGSKRANRLQFGFKRAALIIVIGHVLATMFAVSALKLEGGIIPWLLSFELGLLLVGLLVHRKLHKTHSISRWATFRLVAEIARSVQAIGSFPLYLEHFFTLPFPASFRPLLRTISVLHLKDNAKTDATRWETQRDAYVEKRLKDSHAQIQYHERTRNHAAARLKIAHWVFYTASISAFIATVLKLLTLGPYLPIFPTNEASLKAILGALAITLPVIAVAALSLAVAFDLEAKRHTSEEMLQFLTEQQSLLENASSAREFGRLVIETETRLLGETVNWYARRSFVGVA